MGDEGRLYVDAAILPVYKSLLPHADLILPNCFEAEILSDVKISDRPSLTRAVQKLHQEYRTPHIIVTSVRSSEKKDTLAVFGSSSRSGPFFCLSPMLSKHAGLTKISRRNPTTLFC